MRSATVDDPEDDEYNESELLEDAEDE